MIGHRNETAPGHIITIEDPVEFVHDHKQCIVTQREVGVDTDSFDAALKNTLRQHPDLILIGEIRDMSTMEHAINIAETRHLALATLHANNANQAIDRVVYPSPPKMHHPGAAQPFAQSAAALFLNGWCVREKAAVAQPRLKSCSTSAYIKELVARRTWVSSRKSWKKTPETKNRYADLRSGAARALSRQADHRRNGAWRSRQRGRPEDSQQEQISGTGQRRLEGRPTRQAFARLKQGPSLTDFRRLGRRSSIFGAIKAARNCLLKGWRRVTRDEFRRRAEKINRPP